MDAAHQSHNRGPTATSGNNGVSSETPRHSQPSETPRTENILLQYVGDWNTDLLRDMGSNPSVLQTCVDRCSTLNKQPAVLTT